MESKVARQYVSRIRKSLVCSAASRRRLLSRGQALVAQFDQENPDARYSDYVSAFGPPEDFAGEMLSAVDSGEVEAVQRRRRRGKWIALAVLVLALLAVAAFWFVKWDGYQKIFNGEFVTINSDPQQITEEDYYAMFEKGD